MTTKELLDEKKEKDQHSVIYSITGFMVIDLGVAGFLWDGLDKAFNYWACLSITTVFLWGMFWTIISTVRNIRMRRNVGDIRMLLLYMVGEQRQDSGELSPELLSLIQDMTTDTIELAEVILDLTLSGE